MHNGVIENFSSLKNFLLKEGVQFSSDTDSEVLCNLIAYHYNGLPRGKIVLFMQLVWLWQSHAVLTALQLCALIVGNDIRCWRGSPLVVGIGEDANFIASDASAFVGRAKEAVFLKDGELAILRGGDFRITDQDGHDAKLLPSHWSRPWRKWNWNLIPLWKKKSLSSPCTKQYSKGPIW